MSSKTDSLRLVDKLWTYCNGLRDDDVGVIEYAGRGARKLNPASEVPRTTKLWLYDLRTNQHLTLKPNLDITWPRDESIVEDLTAALAEFEAVAAALESAAGQEIP